MIHNIEKIIKLINLIPNSNLERKLDSKWMQVVKKIWLSKKD
jgi:hypothetical protein